MTGTHLPALTPGKGRALSAERLGPHHHRGRGLRGEVGGRQRLTGVPLGQTAWDPSSSWPLS